MKILIYVFLSMIFLFVSCSNDENNTDDSKNNSDQTGLNVHSGKVVEKMDGSGYSFIQINENDKNYWIAVTQMDIEEGDMIYFSKFMEMRDFRSKSLDKTFTSILFVDNPSKTPITGGMLASNPHQGLVNKSDIIVDKIPGGKTIAEIYKEKDDLHRKQVKVRGKVVKVNEDIMDRNWIHIQDGTADGDNFDLLLITKQSANVGDVIVAEGEIVLDRDFGAGYAYAVIMENAKIIR